MIPKILHTPLNVAQHVVVGAARFGLHGATAVVKLLRHDEPSRPVVRTEPVEQPPSPTTTPAGSPVKKTAAPKPVAKKAAGKKTTAKKVPKSRPASALDEDPAPITDDPVVHSTGPEVATTLADGDLDELRP